MLSVYQFFMEPISVIPLELTELSLQACGKTLPMVRYYPNPSDFLCVSYHRTHPFPSLGQALLILSPAMKKHIWNIGARDCQKEAHETTLILEVSGRSWFVHGGRRNIFPPAIIDR